MRRVEAILAAAMAFSLSGCVVGNKPQTVSAAPAPPKPVSPPTPAPPTAPLSMPQTLHELPPPQPLSAEAIASTEPQEEAPATPALRPKPPRSGQGRTTTASRTTDPVGPAAPSAPPAESEARPQIQEIVPAAELRRLQAEADKTKLEIRQRLQQVGRRRLTPKEQETKNSAVSLLRQSEEAQQQGDMRKASELANRSLLLVKLLPNGR
jgi:hypothetical protein